MRPRTQRCLLKAAARALSAWRLSEATVYVTKKLCVMCAGAMVAALIKRLVFEDGADPEGGRGGQRGGRGPQSGPEPPHRRSAGGA